MKVTPDMLLRPVEGHDDLFAFNFGFGLAPEGKAVPENTALAEETVTELDDGDLLIEGWAANFEGDDRFNENFTDGAFQRGITTFLNGQAPLCFHHKFEQGIGTVLDLKEVEGKGLYMKARVDKQEPSSPLHYIYNAVKKGSYKGLSVGGFFKRKLTDAGMKIADVDMTEVSVTPVSVHPGTSFGVVAGKALETADVDKTQDETYPDFSDTLTKLSESLEGLNSLRIPEEKALPKSHEPGEAGWLADLLQGCANLRTAASITREVSENNDLTSLANDVESSLVQFESTAHKLAAKIGPLPPRGGVGY